MKTILSLITTLLISQTMWAHAFWVETKSTGQKNQPHTVNVFFAEPDGSYEPTDGKEWGTVKNFELYLVSPKGEKTKLSTTKEKDHYTAVFTPATDGRYFVVVENINIGVVGSNPERTFIPFFYASSFVDVGSVSKENATLSNLHKTIPMSIMPVQKTKDSVTLFVQNKKEYKSHIAIFGPFGKITEFKDLGTGKISFKIPTPAIYRIESIVVDKTPGTYDKKAYKTAYHMATTVLDLN